MHPNNHQVGNVRTLPSRMDALADRRQAAADDAALARDERNEEIADGVTFDALEISTIDCAVIDAALARGRLEDVYAVWGVLIAARAAEIARRIAAADRGIVAPRYRMTYCSSCGAELGPGNAGVSHCSDHRAPASRLLSRI
ncbi:hypothetical protein BLA13014_03835 [Burkholderia aenigmatica]|uniref:Uncharacterized protein n=1 Tax=Burkholderia aenigmatica TaxID=2015348 RepID=A0A6P2MIC9_9BURK|nr:MULTISPECIES: hypothetical protein [Burkholderia]VWB83162.1 hypothetical protein BLA13014_03835 [Burkholderia aenigmatica]